MVDHSLFVTVPMEGEKDKENKKLVWFTKVSGGKIQIVEPPINKSCQIHIHVERSSENPLQISWLRVPRSQRSLRGMLLFQNVINVIT